MWRVVGWVMDGGGDYEGMLELYLSIHVFPSSSLFHSVSSLLILVLDAHPPLYFWTYERDCHL